MRNVPPFDARCAYVWGTTAFLWGTTASLWGSFFEKSLITPFFVAKFDLRTSDAHFIKKSAVRGTASTCDSL